MNLAGSGDGERRKSGPAASPDRERSRVSAKRLCKAANIGDFGLREGAAGQERKPDAGASAGDKSLARPAARQGVQEARHRAPSIPGREGCRRFAGRITSKGCPRAGESGVGSNAGPICIAAPAPSACNPGLRESESRPAKPAEILLRAAAPQRASPQIAGVPASECPSSATRRCAGLLLARPAT